MRGTLDRVTSVTSWFLFWSSSGCPSHLPYLLALLSSVWLCYALDLCLAPFYKHYWSSLVVWRVREPSFSVGVNWGLNERERCIWSPVLLGMQEIPQVDTQSEFYELLMSSDHNSKCCCPEAFLDPLASLSSFQCVATYYIPVQRLSFIILHIHPNLLFFAAFAFTSALCSHIPPSFSFTAIVLAIIYDVYTTFHIAVYIPTLIKQLMPHNSVNKCVVEYIEAKINGAWCDPVTRSRVALYEMHQTLWSCLVQLF